MKKILMIAAFMLILGGCSNDGGGSQQVVNNPGENSDSDVAFVDGDGDESEATGSGSFTDDDTAYVFNGSFGGVDMERTYVYEGDVVLSQKTVLVYNCTTEEDAQSSLEADTKQYENLPGVEYSGTVDGNVYTSTVTLDFAAIDRTDEMYENFEFDENGYLSLEREVEKINSPV